MKKNYFPALDSLRFFASLSIVLMHFSTSNLISWANGTVFNQIMKVSFINANLFFVLSGFIYSVLFNGRELKLGSFMKERFWRLYPLHIACTLAIFAITIYRTTLLDNPAYALKTLALHISLLWALVPNMGHHLNQPSWTLTVFFLCYAITPAFLKFMRQKKNCTICLLFLGTWVLLLLAVLCYGNLPNVFRGIIFFSGLLLGELFLRKAIFLPQKALLNDFFLILSGILLYIDVYFLETHAAGISHHIISPLLYCSFVLLLANNKGFIVKILSISWLRAVGRASFYVYLLHCVVIEALHLYLYKVTHWEYIPFDNITYTIVIMVLLYGSCTAYNQVKSHHKGKKYRDNDKNLTLT